MNTIYEVHRYNAESVKINDNIFINDKEGVVKETKKEKFKGFNLYTFTLENGQIIKIFGE